MTPPVVAAGTNATDITARVTAAAARIAEVARPEARAGVLFTTRSPPSKAVRLWALSAELTDIDAFVA
jgi:hypothetical protein